MAGLERFELELIYLGLTFLLLDSLAFAQTSKVSYSQIFLRLVMRYWSITEEKRALSQIPWPREGPMGTAEPCLGLGWVP